MALTALVHMSPPVWRRFNVGRARPGFYLKFKSIGLMGTR